MIQVFQHTLMITGFIFVMMLVIEYVNVLTEGEWQTRLIQNRWGQYIFASFVGALPGCLGPFAIVSLFSHRMISFGAVVAAMIATSGDESFIMLAMIPKVGLTISFLLFLVGIAVGALTDWALKNQVIFPKIICQGYQTHPSEHCYCLPPLKTIFYQWTHCSIHRGVLGAVLVLMFFGIVSNQVGPVDWNWIKITILILSLFALFIVIVVPDHFLDLHLWQHVVRRHVPKVFFWTLGALSVMFWLTQNLPLQDILQENQWAVLLTASLVGLIPESGPHYIFVTLYSQDLIPFSILLASSIVQDGHGMLPMLAYSPKIFLVIKAINFLIGILVGALIMFLGF
ncbi:MAG: hypothetical protein G3M70_10780 [Candidatus Nitronauta litoralis]|uniref:Selenocysteine protein n=1 Tax=Candidatus Nitronauta litoralis TaxID=2705533 RepID=A0A7T0BWJ4_9BACT|nr:MAG: hypothetical protein G3M70_10780 [Candidatus Nitronauta litoralis]